MHFTWCSVPQTLSVKGQGSNIYMSRFKMLAVNVYWQLETTMWTIKGCGMHGGQTRNRFYSDELTMSNRLPGEGLWWSEKAQKGTKYVKSKQCLSSLLNGERPWLKQIHRDSPRHHIQRVHPEISMESRGWWYTQVWLSVITAAYVDKDKISLALVLLLILL